MEKALIEDRWDVPKANVRRGGKIKQKSKTKLSSEEKFTTGG